MKIVFKINLKRSRIPEWIKVPKTLVYGKPYKNKLPNFVEKEYLNKEFTFETSKGERYTRFSNNIWF